MIKGDKHSMVEEELMGYSREEYYKISTKNGLPKRCPILRDCCRAVQTRYEMGFKLAESDISFEEFLTSRQQHWDEDKMIKAILPVTWSSAHDIFYSVYNVCPEVTLFEPDYLPFNYHQSAFSEATYRKESRRFEAVASHYSECAEYSEYCFRHMNKGKGKRRRSPFSSTLKIEIFQRDKFRCHYCKRHKDELKQGVHLTIDHKVPYVDGGDDSFSNLVTACSECNGGKSHKVINDL